MGTDRIEMNAYQDTIAAVRKLLQDNPEWIARYKGYIDTFAEKKAAGTFSRAQRQFAVPAPFSYICLCLWRFISALPSVRLLSFVFMVRASQQYSLTIRKRKQFRCK